VTIVSMLPVENLDTFGRALLQNSFGLFANPVSGAQLDVVSHVDGERRYPRLYSCFGGSIDFRWLN